MFAIAFVVCLFSISTILAATMTTTEHDAYQSSCAEEFNLQLDDVRKYHARYQANLTITKEIKCFEKCFFEKAGIINADGDIIEDAAVDMLSMGEINRVPIVKSTLEKCKNLNEGEQSCEAVYKVLECIIKGLTK